jgi:ATP-dependent Clp protease ATP-binding subunit ClpA
MFERFTDRARRVVVLAQEEARLLNHNYIGTEHILLGLIQEGHGVAAKALAGLDIPLERARSEVEHIIGRGRELRAGHIPFTPRAKKVLELSLREALQLGHNYIGTEHILLGLLREGEGVAAQVLQKLGADLNRVRQQVIQLLREYTGEGEEASEPGQTVAYGPFDPPLSAGSRFVLGLAASTAKKMDHRSIRPVDLLVGLFAAGDREVARMLESLGVDIDALRQRIEELDAAPQAPDEEGPTETEG